MNASPTAELQTSHAGSRRPRILCLAPQEPWPATDGGKEGIHGAVEALAAKADLLVSCPGRPANQGTSAHFVSLGVDYRPVDFVPQESAAVILSATCQLKPFKFHKYGDATAERLFDAAIGPFQPDAIICFHAHMEGLGQRLMKRRGWAVPLLVREHNIEYELVTSHLAARPGWQRVLGAPFQWLTRREEQRIWARADVTAFLSDRDFNAATACNVVGGRLALAPEGVPIPPRRAAIRPAGPPQLLIPLNRRAPQSVANLRSFLHDYWAVVADRPELVTVSVAVTGVDAEQLAGLTQMTVESQARLRVQALGFLPSLLPAFEQALALVAPTFIGGGIRKKILEGMAHQVPIIATDLDIATCGYFRHDDNILRLGAPQDFAVCVSRLLCDAALWQKLSDNGRRTVEQHADWAVCADVLLRELGRIAGPAQPTVSWMQ